MTETQTANQRLGLAPTDPRPANETGPLADRQQTNPLFNDQKMKLGLFGTNCSYGLIMSHAPTTYEATWAHTVAIAQRADALGFEAMIPVARCAVRHVCERTLGPPGGARQPRSAPVRPPSADLSTWR